MAEIGKWNAELFAEFRTAAGPPPPPAKGWRRGPPPALSARVRHLQGLLVQQNEPLIKVLVAQLCGVGDHRKRRRLGGMQGVELIPWDDAMQAGRIGFAKALMAFNPSKGKISYFALHKIRYELQLLIPTAATIKIGIDRIGERPACALVGEQRELDALHRDSEHFDMAEIDGLTPELVAQWRDTGEWPELEEFQAMIEAARAPKVVVSIPSRVIVLTPLEQFLKARCAFAARARVTQFELWSAFEHDCRRRGTRAPTRGALVRELAALRGVREVKVWNGGSPVRGVAGVRMAMA